jgi:hypothetical protein
MSALIQLIGGSFQDVQGNPLAAGYLTMELSQDEETNDSLICSGITITVPLDANGSIITSPPQYVWGNDQMLPVNSFYKVTGYTAEGQAAWGPCNQQVIGSGGTFDVGTWIPNQVIVWVPSPQPIAIEVNGVALSSSTSLNLTAGTGITLTDEGGGTLQISSSGGSGLPLDPPSRFVLYTAMNTIFGEFANPVNDLPVSFEPGGTSATEVAPTATNGYGLSVSASDQVQFAGTPFALPANGIVVQGTLQVSADGTFYVGVSSLSADILQVYADNNPSGPVEDPAGGTFDSALVGVTNTGTYKLITTRGGSKTVTDSGVAVTSARHTFQLTISTGKVILTLDGNVVATSTTNTPVAGVGANFYLPTGSIHSVLERLYVVTASV